MCSNGNECGIGQFMNDKGECIPCPKGTEKNTTGCGPCRAIRNIIHLSMLTTTDGLSTGQRTHTPIHLLMLTTTDGLSTGQRTYTPTVKYNKSVISPGDNTDIHAEKLNEGTVSFMYIFYIGLALIITAALVISLVVYRRSGKICAWCKCAIKDNRRRNNSESTKKMLES